MSILGMGVEEIALLVAILIVGWTLLTGGKNLENIGSTIGKTFNNLKNGLTGKEELPKEK